ncbi:hypothetical protein KUTeg_008716 [Tegillarca granosa]|uniref:SH3b domain-containing protein n=1 Tax=Tegillarca granosa TaxID=220873 RepID=A0ABQ9FCZ5_TEGGR|nr:hypothetical protein KUTeg_008716 [Tegillarca granosa]
MILLQILLLNLLPLYYTSLPSTNANKCACATDNVNVRTGSGTNYSVIGILRTNQCVNKTGHFVDNVGTKWASVVFKDKLGWIASNWLTDPITGGSITGCPKIIPRSEWGAMEPRGIVRKFTSQTLPTFVILHHGATESCHTEEECSKMVRNYQRFHMNGWSDIGFNFVIGEDGNVYEGRGWQEIGVHTVGYNSVSLGIGIIGDFTSRLPNEAALNATKQLVKCGFDNGYISPNSTLIGHRDVGSTACPGTRLWELIHSWSHYNENGIVV